MMMKGFLDELVKLGCAAKLAEMSTDVPASMMDNDQVPASVRVIPSDSSTRALTTVRSLMEAGVLGPTTAPKEPVDAEEEIQ